MLKSNAKNVYVIFPRGVNTNVFYELDEYGIEWIEFLLRKELEKLGYTLKFSVDGANLIDVAAIISWEVNQTIWTNLASYPRERCFLLCFEPPNVRADFYMPQTKERFGKIFVFFDTPVDHMNYFRFYVPIHEKRCLTKPKYIPDFTEKKLCAAIHTNGNPTYNYSDDLYNERKKIFAYFAQKEDFELWGRRWEGYPQWKGFTDNLIETYKNYRFSFIYENWKNHKGYITERLFAGLSSRTVPIYLGASDIADYVPEDCFIDARKFSSYEQIYQFMKNMDKQTYEKHQKSIENYLNNKENMKLFSKENWVKTIIDQLNS